MSAEDEKLQDAQKTLAAVVGDGEIHMQAYCVVGELQRANRARDALRDKVHTLRTERDSLREELAAANNRTRDAAPLEEQHTKALRWALRMLWYHARPSLWGKKSRWDHACCVAGVRSDNPAREVSPTARER